MITIPGIAFIIFVLTTAVLGMTFGVLIERIRWNNLITGGKLPRPKNGRRKTYGLW